MRDQSSDVIPLLIPFDKGAATYKCMLRRADANSLVDRVIDEVFDVDVRLVEHRCDVPCKYSNISYFPFFYLLFFTYSSSL